MAISDAIVAAEAAAELKGGEEAATRRQRRLTFKMMESLAGDLVDELKKRRALKSALVRTKEQGWDPAGAHLPKVILLSETWVLGELAVSESGTFHRYSKLGIVTSSDGEKVYASGVHAAGAKFAAAKGYRHILDGLFGTERPADQQEGDAAEAVFHLKDGVLCWGQAHTPAEQYFAEHLVALPAAKKI